MVLMRKIIAIPMQNGGGACMNKRSGSTLVSVICSFFILSVCVCIMAVSFNTLLKIRNKAERFSGMAGECEAAFYSGEGPEASVSEKRENVTVYDENGDAVFSFDAVIRKAECGEVEIYGFSANE